MADSYTEQLPHAEGFIIHEFPGTLSREQVTIRGGFSGAAVLHPGTVMGKRDDGKWQQLNESSTEGEAAVKGILCGRVDPTSADVKGVVIERLAEVRESDLIWPAGISTANKNAGIAELLALNIKVRDVADKTTTQST